MIALTVAPGGKVDYYFYQPMAGSLTANRATSAYFDVSTGTEYIREGTYTLKTNYWYSCVIENCDGTVYIYIGFKKQGGDQYVYMNTEYTDDFNDFYKD